MMEEIGSRHLLDVANLYISGKLTAVKGTQLLELLQTLPMHRSQYQEAVLREIGPFLSDNGRRWGNATIIGILNGVFTVEIERVTRYHVRGMLNMLQSLFPEGVEDDNWPILPRDFRRAGCDRWADELEKTRTLGERQRFFSSCDLSWRNAWFMDDTHYVVRLAGARLNGIQLPGPFGDFADKETTDRVCRETFWPDGKPAPEPTPRVGENEPTTLRSLGKKCTLF
jgi:hypothetical protein